MSISFSTNVRLRKDDQYYYNKNSILEDHEFVSQTGTKLREN
jgi:hypothetical protein